MREGENKMEEKSQFNGNLALFRVCAAILIVNMLSLVVSMFFLVGHGGAFSLWHAFTSASFEDILSMVGLILASCLDTPLGLGILAVIVAFALGIFAIVKKNVTALKILAVLMAIWSVLLPYFVGSGKVSLTGLIFNLNYVVAVATFFITPRKHLEESKDGVAPENFNLGLYRFCAVFFLVAGLGGTFGTICGHAFFLAYAVFNIIAVLAGAAALVKKNTIILMACSLVMIVQVFWRLASILHVVHFNSVFPTILAVSAVANCFLNAMLVVCVATLFIEPERIRRFLQKIKRS